LGDDVSGKRSKQRPTDRQRYADNWDRIFGKVDESKCKQCAGNMRTGKAIEQTYTGIPDFPGDKYSVTLSPGGAGKLVDCMKCRDCGWSAT